MSSKRQTLCTAIDTALKAILKTNGHQTDLGNHVFEWRSTPLEDAELPGIVWRDRGNTYEGPVTGRTSNELNLELEIHYSGSTASTKMRDCISDVRKCLMDNDTWGNLAIGTSLIEDETSDIVQADKKVGGTEMKFTIKYVTSSTDF